MKIKIAITLLALIVLGATAYFGLTLFYDFEESPAALKTVFIPRNSSLAQAAKLLEAGGVIKSSPKFKILVALLMKEQKIKPGEYEFVTPDHPINILKRIVSGKLKTYKVTFPEGFTLREIARELADRNLTQYEKFVSLETDKAVLDRFKIKSASVEGYLFPETYILDKMMTEKGIIEAMIERFFKEIPEELVENSQKIGMTLNQVITLASMIEKETGIDRERSVIASVFHNRLRKGMRMQCDPTVIYGIRDYYDREKGKSSDFPRYDGNLKKIHLTQHTPYNTYLVKGLPLGPICNPGLASIKAAVLPAETKYLYFVAKNDGSHIFSETYEEHAKNVRIYQQGGLKRSLRLSPASSSE